jgi:glycosyltransferase involved in cell wall biosynthesis
VQDLFPEVAAAHNIRLARGIPGAILKFLRNWAYWASAACAVLGQVMAERLNRQGIPSERTRVLPNWSDGEDIRPLAHSDNPLRLEWGLIESFVVGYSGNLGRAHDIHTMLGAAREMEGQCPDVTFLLVGGGAQRPWVEQRVYEQGMTNMHLKPYQPWERLSESLCAADIHLVSLRPEMEGLIFPSKLYGVLAAGRPVVFIGDPHGEAARLIRDTNCGVAVAQGDSAGLTQVIRELRADPERVLAMGRRARNLFESRFDRNQALPAWEELLAEVAENR